MEKHLHGILLLVIAGALYINVQTQHETKETAKSAAQQNEFNIGISEQSRLAVADQLSTLLADLYVLYTKTLKYHWNVEGPFFNDLHKFFGNLYEKQLAMIDRVAERIRALGKKSPGTLSGFIKQSTIQENPGNNPAAQGMIRDLLLDYNTVIRSMRSIADSSARANDVGTNNFMGDLIEQSEKTAWMLRSLLAR